MRKFCNVIYFNCPHHVVLLIRDSNIWRWCLVDSKLHSLAIFYKTLDKTLQPQTMDCGLCGECCRRAAGLQVYPLELQYISRFVQNPLIMQKFINFIENKRVKIWGEIAGQCPFQQGDRCSIYAVRPYFCRVYGPYNLRGKNLLPGCVYNGHSTTYFDQKELPLYDQFLNLVQKSNHLYCRRC